MSDYGTRLTARFFEALGYGYEPESQPRPDDPGAHDEGAIYWRGNEAVMVLIDYTQPGHLETVIGMVRERCDAMDWLSDFSIRWSVREGKFKATLERRSAEVKNDNLATALMLAAIRAAGLEPPEVL